MSGATLTIIVAVVGVVGTIIGAAVSAWLNRDKDDADVATKVSQAWGPVFERQDVEMKRLDERCNKCETVVSLLRVDFGAFADVMEEQAAVNEELMALLPEGDARVRARENQRKTRVAIAAARKSHLTHNG
jgi:hypothetical protein